MQITIIQTADPVKYLPIIRATERVNRLYAKLHGCDYAAYKELVRGRSPVHAAFNRVYLMDRMREAGYRGWIAYLDSDAYFGNLYFDLSDYLAANAGHCFIAARASADPRKWAINNGVFFLNLGHPLGQRLVQTYRHYVDRLVPQSYWEQEDAAWPPQEYDDQNILFSVLAHDAEILDNMKNEESAFNCGPASAIAQIVRDAYPSFAERVAAIEQACDGVINAFVQDINPFLVKTWP